MRCATTVLRHPNLRYERASAFGLASGLTQVIRFGMIPGSYLDD
jgi:hypothetical protein